MADNRKILSGTLLALLAGWVVWHIYSGWGLVTLEYTDAPLRTVLSSLSRQGRINIETNLDPATPVTIKVRRVRPLEALDIVAVRTEASWRLAYLGARDDQAIDAALSAFRLSQPTDGWSSFGGGGFSLVESPSGAALDLRRAVWKPSGGTNLHSTLQAIAGGTGVFLAAPADWNPAISSPSGGEVRRAVPGLFAKLGGRAREVFLLRGAPQRPESGDPDGDGPRWGRSWIGSNPTRGEGRSGPVRGPGGDPEQAAARAEAQIALLPMGEQAEARKELETMRQFWREMRDLPEDQRRAKAQEFFSRPEMAERMEDRRLAREAKMTPEQRNRRAQRYFERKQALKSGVPPQTGGARP